MLCRDEDSYHAVHGSGVGLVWVPLAKREAPQLLSRRLSFEMAQTSALKHNREVKKT